MYLRSLDWKKQFSLSIIKSLPRLQSDHTPLLLFTDISSSHNNTHIKFESIWLSQEGFKELLVEWWNSYIIKDNVGEDWKCKLQFIRRKLRG